MTRPNAGHVDLELAHKHRREGRAEQAYAVCEALLARNPAHAEALFLTGTLDLEGGRAARAVERLEAAVKLAPSSAAYATNLGLAYGKLGSLAQAEEALRRAVSLEPTLMAAVHNLGLVLCDRGGVDEGLALLRRAADAEPRSLAMQYSLAKALLRADRGPEALERFERAVTLSPKAAELCLDFVARLEQAGKFAPAEALAERATRLDPSRAAGFAALGGVQLKRGNNTGAVESFRRAIALDSALAVPLVEQRALALMKLGRLEEASVCREQALSLEPKLHATHSALVFCAPFRPGLDAEQILAEAARWNERHARPLLGRREPFPHDRSPERRLRLAYVSGDFRDHVQRFFTLPVFQQHDRAAFELVCYSSVKYPDAWTERIKSRADAWHDVSRLGDAALARKIREDRIDVLVDLTMHMPGSRLRALAEKPAPVQIAWLAYPGTTGVDGIDYRLTDPFLDPPGAPLPYSEQSLWLPHSFWCYDPLGDEPPVNALPARQAGHVTFGCLNNFMKVNRETLELWAQVLAAVPDSKLLLLAPVGRARELAAAVLAQHGLNPARLAFVDRQTRHEYLVTHQRIDVALDCLPYNGHTTSLDAFFMGVPVVTQLGQTIVGRAGLSMAENLGLGELVARSSEEFVTIASGLARSLGRLETLRQGLRERLRRSPLMDAPRFTRELEGAYRTAWRRFATSSAE